MNVKFLKYNFFFKFEKEIENRDECETSKIYFFYFF